MCCKVHHGLCWADVASKVKTRTDKQCRAKWLNFLNWKQKGGTEWAGPADDLLLLDKYVVCASEVCICNCRDVTAIELSLLRVELFILTTYYSGNKIDDMKLSQLVGSCLPFDHRQTTTNLTNCNQHLLFSTYSTYFYP